VTGRVTGRVTGLVTGRVTGRVTARLHEAPTRAPHAFAAVGGESLSFRRATCGPARKKRWAGFIGPLTVDKHHAGHEGTLGALARREVAAFDKQCVEARFFRIVQCDESVQVLGFHARRCYCMSDAELKDRIKTMMVESLMLRMKPEDIGDDVPLFAPDGLALDSIDALELAVGLEKTFGVATPSAEVARTAFLDVNSIAAFVQKSTPPSA
jgi:acyl carrier protein